MMTADSLDLSAVTPAAEGQRSTGAKAKGQSHSTPIEQPTASKQPLKTRDDTNKKHVRVQPTTSSEPPVSIFFIA